MATTEDEIEAKEREADRQLSKVDPDLARQVATRTDKGNDLSARRRKMEHHAKVLDDINAGTEPEWEPITVPRWRNLTVWVRGLTTGERAKLRKDGYRTVNGPDGEPMLQETGELEALLVQMSTFIEPGGEHVFKDGPDSRVLIKRQQGGVLDEIVQAALRLSGLTKKATEDAKESFLDNPTNGSDFDLPETWE